MILDTSGKIVSQPLRTSFGALIEQPVSDDPARIPIGFYGGIKDPESGVIILVTILFFRYWGAPLGQAQPLYFKHYTRANPIGAPFRCFLLG